MKFLVTGAAGFIGFHTSQYLLNRGDIVIGIDNLNDYYDISLKEARLTQLQNEKKFSFHKIDITDKISLDNIFELESPEKIIHLAAQAGVRHSITNPYAYIDSNILGFLNILEVCRSYPVKHMVFASSSSVYGANTSTPFSVTDNVDHPLSLYGATKKSNELMAHAYSHLYDISMSGLRFFTVYGPWGRPDMALFIFTKKIINGEPISIFNNGQHKRDFTYIDDIVESIVRVADNTATSNEQWNSNEPDPATSRAKYRLYNIGNNSPVDLMYFIDLIEKNINKKAIKKFLPLQPGDVSETHANIDTLVESIDYSPQTSIEAGIENFIKWYTGYYKV
jgi:UDP-glucuronate 4-epimerase